MELLATGGMGRLVFNNRYGLTALPVAYKIDGGSIVLGTWDPVTARQVQKALAELPASLPARSLRPPLLSTRLTRSPAHREQLHRQPVGDRRARGLKSRVCLARPQPYLPT